MTKGVHPKNEIRQALKFATKEKGWTLEVGGSYRWGIIWCPAHEHFVTIKSTPQDAGNHANKIRRAIDHCSHKPEEG